MSMASSRQAFLLNGLSHQGTGAIRPATIAVALLPGPEAGGDGQPHPLLSSAPAPRRPLPDRWADGRRGCQVPRGGALTASISRSKRSPSPSMQRNTKRLFRAKQRQGINPGPRFAVGGGDIHLRLLAASRAATLLLHLLGHSVPHLPDSWVELRLCRVSCPRQTFRADRPGAEQLAPGVNDGPSVEWLQHRRDFWR